MPSLDPAFIKPRYDSSGFASLPRRVTELLTPPQKYDAVVLLLIDGFGWRFFEKFQQEPFLKNILRQGRVEKLTAQFPSTTAAEITTLHTGLPVGEHGVYEWYYYEPTLDALIAPLLFSFAGTSQRDTLKPSGARPRRLFPFPSLYQGLKKQGIASTVFQHREYTPSSIGDVLFAGAKALGYKTLPEALVNLAEALSRAASPSYFVLYHDRVDGLCHEYGPDSPQVTAEIRLLLMTLEAILLKAVMGSRKKVLFLLTADHGESETDPQTTIFLNREPRFAGVERFLRTDRQGGLIVPAGSPRDFFLYIRPGLLDDAQAFLAARLEGAARVLSTAGLAAEGCFGPLLSPRFQARLGDLVILPYRYGSVWWYEKNRFEQRYYGHHGGLTPEEMEIPLISWEM
jgi:predicted AlkP superfamily pyrophosphatase or phosphodiesterase